MPRRTKADAEATRHRLLDAAEQLFQSRGVSRTSLQDIASAAGATRGAVYWHFKDKADLFNAMMERVTLPLEQALPDGDVAPQDALTALYGALLHALQVTAQDARTQRVFEVATHMVEYGDEMHAVRERHLRIRNECVARTRLALEEAAGQQQRPLALPAQAAALGLHVMVDGLIQNWLLDPGAFDLEQTGQDALGAYLRGLGFEWTDARGPHPAAAARAT